MTKPYDLIDDLIRRDRNMGDLIKELERDRAIDSREIDRFVTVATDIADLIDRELRPRERFEDILVSAFIALITRSAEEARIPNRYIPREYEDIMRSIDKLYDDAVRSADRGHDRDRDRDRDYRDDRNRDEGRFISRGSSHRNDSPKRGFGKGSKFKRGSQEEENREVETVAKVEPPKFDLTTAFDSSRFKVEGGQIVESYEEHELTREFKFSKGKVEETRQALFTEYDDNIKNTDIQLISTYSSANDFINCTDDLPIVIGMLESKVNFSAVLKGDETVAGGVLDINLSETDNIERVNKILRLLEGNNTPSVKRLYTHINELAVRSLTIAFNMFSRVNASFKPDFVSEWTDTKSILSNNDVIDSMHVDELYNTLRGLLGNMVTIYTDDNDNLIVQSRAFITKVAGGVVTKTEMCGTDQLATILRDKNPELESAVSTSVELRDKYYGDAWSKEGMLPVIVSDSLGNCMAVYATKGSDEKFTTNNWVTNHLSVIW